MILDVFSSGPVSTNTYLVGCSKTKKAFVIDVPFDSVDWILKRSRELSLTIDKILITHSHWDHTAHVAALKRESGVPVYVHREDVGNLEKPGSDQLPLFFPIEPVNPDVFLEGGEVLFVGKLRIEVISTPGHTLGGVCFYLPQEKVLFSGDTLFKGTIGNLSFPTARPALMWESLKKLSQLPADTTVFPGHGLKTTIGKEKWLSNPEKQFGYT